MDDTCSAAGIAGPDINCHFKYSEDISNAAIDEKNSQRLNKVREIVKCSARAEERRLGLIDNFLRALSSRPAWAGLLLEGRRLPNQSWREKSAPFSRIWWNGMMPLVEPDRV
jgi:hypothetical protein